MGERGPTALRYGHLGLATYLPDTQSWEFSRCINRSPPYLVPFQTREFEKIFAKFFTSTGKRKENGDDRDDFPPQAERQFDVSRRSKEDQLIKNHPEFAPSLPLLHENDMLSQVLLKTASRAYGVTSTLAIGCAAPIGHSYNKRRRYSTTAFVTPDSPNFVQIVASEQRKLAWSYDYDAPDGRESMTRTVVVPVIGERQRAFFTEHHGQVLQIAYAEAIEEDSTWMALRFPRSTIVFHPLHHRTASAPNYSLDGRIAPDAEFSRLNANPVVHIPITSTGSCQHADASFNPWYQQEVAIIDTEGNWSVWDVSKIHGKTNVWGKSLVIQGSLHELQPHGPSSNVSVVVKNTDGSKNTGRSSLRDCYDGWAKILWVANVHTYLVCNRRNLVVFRHDTDAKKLTGHIAKLKFVSDSEWILDVSRSPASMSDVFLLTTTRIIWFHINETDDEGEGDESRDLGAVPRLSWFHFRDHEDITLKLAPLMVAGESSVLLYSQTNSLAELFRFGYSKNEPSIPISVSDPSIIPLPSEDTGAKQSPLSATSCFSSSASGANIFSHVILQEIPDSHLNDQKHNNRRHSLVKFTGQRSDYTLVESLFIATIIKNDDDGDNDTDYESLQQSRPIVKELRTLSEAIIEDEFLVPDWYEEITPSTAFQGHKRHISSFPQAQHNVVDLTRVYRNTIVVSHALQRPSFDEWVQNFTEIMENSDRSREIRCPTLSEIFDNAPAIDNLDVNAHQYEECVQNLQEEHDWPVNSDAAPNPGFEVQLLPLPALQNAEAFTIAGADSLNQQSIHDLYDSLVRDWILPLSADVPGQARILKEKLVRKVTMELMLARTLVFRKAIAHPSTEDDDAYSLPWSQENDEPLESSSQLPPSSPSSAAPPSSPYFSFTSSQLSSSQSHLLTSSSDQEKPCSTLRKYTKVRQDQPLSRQTINTLAHWKIRGDPSAYNWQATVNALHEEEEVRSESQHSRERRRRREIRREKQRERQLELGSQRSTSTGVPMVRGASSRSVSIATYDHGQHRQEQEHEQGQPAIAVSIPSTPFSSASRTPSQHSKRKSTPQPSSQPQNTSVSSRAVSSGLMSMTQTERGAHGSRETAGRRISKGFKKRAAGF